MLMPTRTYTPKDISLVIGTIPVFAFNEIRIGFMSSRWNFYEGTQGEITRGRVLSRLAVIDLVIPRTEPTNDMLSGQSIFTDTLPVFVKDRLGLSMAHMNKGTLSESPEVIYAKSVTDNIWRIKGRLNINFVGGSSDLQGKIQYYLNPLNWSQERWII
jgi:hypothetical protein